MDISIIPSCRAMTGKKDKLWQYSECYHETERGPSAKIGDCLPVSPKVTSAPLKLILVFISFFQVAGFHRLKSFIFLPTTSTRDTN
jgi:hypothetical protein